MLSQQVTPLWFVIAPAPRTFDPDEGVSATVRLSGSLRYNC